METVFTMVNYKINYFGSICYIHMDHISTWIESILGGEYDKSSRTIKFKRFKENGEEETWTSKVELVRYKEPTEDMLFDLL